MSTIQFIRTRQTLILRTQGGDLIGTWDAANNVDSHSKGPWPDGQYNFSYYVAHPGDPPSSEYGSNGIFVFDVPQREGLGVHSGREGVPDGLGRTGYQHCTMGCIRTTDDATAQLVRTHHIDPITAVMVET